MAAYFIADVDVTDAEEYRRYAQQAGPIIRQYGGKTIVMDNQPETTEGNWHPKRIVIIEFPTVEQARAWYDSPEYTAISDMRFHSAKNPHERGARSSKSKGGGLSPRPCSSAGMVQSFRTIFLKARQNMSQALKFGITSIQSGATSYPEALASVAQAAEQAGFDTLWAGEHHVLATSSTRIPPTSRYLNPVVALTYAAAFTRTIRLGTGVLLLPQHQPLILAKELASLDVLSGGRLIVGIGVGWSPEEYEALGIPYQERGARADEYLAAMRAIWSEGTPSYTGRYVSFHDVVAYPHPVQQPFPPIVVGGSAPAVLRRAVEQANGWYGFAMDLDETAARLAQLREAATSYTRPASLGELEISVAPRIPLDRDTARRFADLGVHRLILIPPRDKDAAALAQWVKTTGETLMGRV